MFKNANMCFLGVLGVQWSLPYVVRCVILRMPLTIQHNRHIC